MRVLVYGATGMVGREVVTELLRRGHEVTAVTRGGAPGPVSGGLTTRSGDVTDPASVADLAPGHDAVVTAVRPAPGEGPERVVDAARTLTAALPGAGVQRLVAVGGAGGLEVSPGVRIVDDPGFDPLYRPFSAAHVEALEVYRAAGDGLDWTMVCCPRVIEPGERTGRYRVGGDQLLRDDAGVSRISTADYAVAVVDELETPAHRRARMSVAY